MTKRLLFVPVLFFSLCGMAQVDTIDTDRPDQTESPSVVPGHYFQAELGFQKENTFDENYNLYYPTALLRYGLKGFEFRLEANYLTAYEHLIPNPQTTNGFDPIHIGFKAALWEEKNGIPKTSLLGSVGIPDLASNELKAQHLAPAFILAMQNSLGKTFALGYNIGLEWDGFSTQPAYIYTLSPGANLGKRGYVFMEAYGSFRKNEKPENNLDAGFAYTVNKDMKIDISGGIGISDEAPDSFIAVGISFRFNTSKK